MVLRYEIIVEEKNHDAVVIHNLIKKAIKMKHSCAKAYKEDAL